MFLILFVFSVIAVFISAKNAILSLKVSNTQSAFKWALIAFGIVIAYRVVHNSFNKNPKKTIEA